MKPYLVHRPSGIFYIRTVENGALRYISTQSRDRKAAEDLLSRYLEGLKPAPTLSMFATRVVSNAEATLFADSTMFVLLSDSRSSFGSFSRWTVSVSSRPSSRLLAASGLIRCSWSAIVVTIARALLSSLSAYACDMRRLTPCTLRLRQIFQHIPLLVGRASLQRDIGAQTIVHRTWQGFSAIDHHEDRGFNRRTTLNEFFRESFGYAAFSVAPWRSPRMCLTPCVSMPSALSTV